MADSTQSKVIDFTIDYYQYLDKDGKLKLDKLPSDITADDLKAMYRMMQQTRTFDTKAIALQRTGKMGTYPSTLGQEAIGVAIGYAMQENDVLCGYYREYGAQFWRGVKMEEILAFWGGDEFGSNYENQPYDFPICIPIASQNLHAVGVATAFKLKSEKRAVVAVVGEGGTSRGDFYEAVNVAGIWNLPVVFVVNNNGWAISVPRDKQSKCETFAQKGIAGGIKHCLQVDGNDIVVLADKLKAALDRCYSGEGPSVIEALTYRMCDHTTADDATRYRDNSEVEKHKLEDPITRLQKYLAENHGLSNDEDKAQQRAIKDEIEAAVDNYLNLPKRSPASMFDNLYETLPEAYTLQREELAAMEDL